VSAASLVRRLRKLEARCRPAELPVRYVLRRRLKRLERAYGEPSFGDGDPEQLRGLAGLVGAAVASDVVGLPAAAPPRALNRAIKGLVRH
jgi:hypothetical protein